VRPKINIKSTSKTKENYIKILSIELNRCILTSINDDIYNPLIIYLNLKTPQKVRAIATSKKV